MKRIVFFAVALSAVMTIFLTTAYAQNAPNPQDKPTLLKLINDYRKSKGKGTLSTDPVLDSAAQRYADLLDQKAATGHTVSMTTPNGKTCTTVDERVALAALSKANNDSSKLFTFSYVDPNAINGGAPQSFWVQGLKVGEILTYGWTTPAEAVKAWQGSSQHDWNMTQDDWTHLGIGISKRKLSNGTYSGYNWVVVFGKPNTSASTQMTLNGRFGAKTMLAKYQYWTNYVKR